MNCNIIDSIKSPESKVRTALCIMTNTSTGMYCSVDFISMMVIHKLGFHAQTQKLEPPNTVQETSSKERTAHWLSFEWSHFRISSTHSKVRSTLYSIIYSTTGKTSSVAFS